MRAQGPDAPHWIRGHWDGASRAGGPGHRGPGPSLHPLLPSGHGWGGWVRPKRQGAWPTLPPTRSPGRVVGRLRWHQPRKARAASPGENSGEARKPPAPGLWAPAALTEHRTPGGLTTHLEAESKGRVSALVRPLPGHGLRSRHMRTWPFAPWARGGRSSS